MAPFAIQKNNGDKRNSRSVYCGYIATEALRRWLFLAHRTMDMN